MRLAVLIDRYPPILGGAQNNVHEMARRLSAMGHAVTVLTRRVYGNLPAREEIDGVSIVRFAHAPVRLVSKLACAGAIVRHLVRERRSYDLVLAVPCVELTDLLPAYLAARRTRCPYVIRTTGFPTFHRPPEGELGVRIRNLLLPPRLWRDVLRGAAAIVTQSSVLRDGFSGYELSRIEVIPNGVDSARFRPADEGERTRLRRLLDLPEDRIVLCNTGRYDHEKNQIALIRAAEAIEHTRRSGAIHVVVLGATQRNQVTSNEEEIKAYVQRAGLGDVIRFVDDASNVEDYLRASDVFVHPTRDEGMSNALLEAMGCGLAIVASDIPQERCMFPDGEGTFFPPEDVDALVSRLLPLLDDHALRREHGRAMDRLARERYANERLVLRYEALFGEIISAGGEIERELQGPPVQLR